MNAARALNAYVEFFGHRPSVLVRAPGRVNLIGEHTDYNDGFVLPCAIDRDTVVAAGSADDGNLESLAVDFDKQIDRFRLGTGFVRAEAEWANYVRGVAAVLIEEGMSLSGARLAITGDVPLGSGLSSSASLEVAVGNALAALAGTNIRPDLMASLAQRAENVHVGCQCGIMDQLISARGVADHALLIDCRSLECRPVALPKGVTVLIAHSGVRHTHAGGEYNDRRTQCDAAARHYGVRALRDLDERMLIERRSTIDDVSFRRARHIVTENARTLAAADALERGNLKTMGSLMAQSHASMRDDFEITVPYIDRLCAVMTDSIGEDGGARMTGGGFGGCVVALLTDDSVTRVREEIARSYLTPDGSPAKVFVCKAVDGASALPLNAHR